MNESSLLILVGPTSILLLPLAAGETVTIGRDEKSASAVVRDRQLSRMHLQVRVNATGSIGVTDLNSHNGSFVDGERLEPSSERILAPESILTMGAHYMWRATSGARWLDQAAFQSELDRHLGQFRLFTIEGRSDASTETAIQDAREALSELNAMRALRDALLRLPKEACITRQPNGALQFALPARESLRLPELVAGFEKMSLDLYEVPSESPPQKATTSPLIGSVTTVGNIDAARIAASDITVLILGETGSGKEVMARHLHASSKRSRGPFVVVNCAALAESLFESELFGHERGAFTGANVARQGYLESATGGTVLFDEVGELSSAMQVKLLRVIETRSIHRVGSVVSRPLDVRFLAATLRDLPSAVAAGTFREDLYFRLSGITLRIPPLRARADDLAEIANTILRGLAPGLSLTERAIARLRAHPWPGNVRELKSVLERSLLVQSGNEIDDVHLIFDAPFTQRSDDHPNVDRNPQVASEDPRYARVADALARSAGNQRRASELLGISRRTLTNWLSELGFPRPRKS